MTSLYQSGKIGVHAPEKADMIKTNYIIRCAVLLLLSAFFFAGLSCSKSDDSTAGAIVGYAVKSDQIDNSGITVTLYRTVAADPQISSVLNQYSIIGFAVNQSCLFDHRTETPIQTTTTNNAGQFAFQDVADGSYNVVAEDSGYGFRYALDLTVRGGETRPDSLILYPIEEPPALITQNTTWQAGHHYRIVQDVQVADGVTLTIQLGAVVRFAGTTGYTKVDVRGTLNSQGEPNEFIRWIREDPERPWNQVNIQNSGGAQNNIIYNLFDGGTIGLRCSYSNLSLQSSIIRNCIGSGVSIEHVIDFRVMNCIFQSCSTGTGMSLTYADAGEISYNVFYDNNSGISCTTYSFPRIHGNWVGSCEVGMFFQQLIPGDGDSLIVDHNQIQDCSAGIRASGSTFGRVTHNNVSNCQDYLISIRPFPAGGYSQPLINYNNITNVGSGGHLIELALAVNTHDVDATSNWWGITNINTLDNLIYDGNDPGNPATGVVIYMPILFQPVPDAGITW